MTALQRRMEQELALLHPVYPDASYHPQSQLLLIPRFGLPSYARKRFTSLLIDIPARYPAHPPFGVYVDRDLHLRGHYYQGMPRMMEFHRQGWAWLCLHDDRSGHPAWRPSADAAHGDNLLRLLVVVRVMLQELCGAA